MSKFIKKQIQNAESKIAGLANRATHVIDSANKEVQYQFGGRKRGQSKMQLASKPNKQNKTQTRRKSRGSSEAIIRSAGASGGVGGIMLSNQSVIRNSTPSRAGYLSSDTERWGTLYGNPNNTISPQVVHVTPVNQSLHPLEHFIAQNFKQYRIKKFKIHYTTELYAAYSGSAVSGKVYIGADEDPDALTPTTDIYFGDLPGTVSGPAPTGLTFDLLRAYPSLRNKTFWMDPTLGSDAKFTTAATIFLTSLNTVSATNVPIGELYVEYTYEYLYRVPPPLQLRTASNFSFISSSNNSASNIFSDGQIIEQYPPLGTLSGGGANGSSSALITTLPTGTQFFPIIGVGQIWMILLTFTGTGLSGPPSVYSATGMTPYNNVVQPGGAYYPNFEIYQGSTYGMAVSFYTQTSTTANLVWQLNASSLTTFNMYTSAVPVYNVSSFRPMTSKRQLQALSDQIHDVPVPARVGVSSEYVSKTLKCEVDDGESSPTIVVLEPKAPSRSQSKK